MERHEISVTAKFQESSDQAQSRLNDPSRGLRFTPKAPPLWSSLLLAAMSNIDQSCIQYWTDVRLRQRDNPVCQDGKSDLTAGLKRRLSTCLYKLAGLLQQTRNPGINSHGTWQHSWPSWPESYGAWASCNMRCGMSSRDDENKNDR